MRGLVQDLRYAVRQLRRAPGFALTALLTLALGIGSVVAVFSVVYSVLLRPYGFEQQGKLVVWHEVIEGDKGLDPDRSRQLQALCDVQDPRSEHGGRGHHATPAVFGESGCARRRCASVRAARVSDFVRVAFRARCSARAGT